MRIYLRNSRKNCGYPSLSNIACLTACALIAGCAAPEQASNTARGPKLTALLDSDFEGFEAPSPAIIKEAAVTRIFPDSTVQEVWDSSLFVLAQRTLIVRASKDTGFIIGIEEAPAGTRYLHSGFPNAVLVETTQGEGNVIVHANWLPDFFRRSDNPTLFAMHIQRDTKEKLANAFFEKVATELYGRKKWKYLWN
jgi:hypothetical protein